MIFEIGEIYNVESFDGNDFYQTLVIPYMEKDDGVQTLIFNQWKRWDWIDTYLNKDLNNDWFYDVDDFISDCDSDELREIITGLFGDIERE